MNVVSGFGQPLRSAAFRSLWLSLLLSSMGDWAARLALAILVLDRTHSVALSGLVLAASYLPWVGPGQILATRLGHLPRIRVMVASDLVRASIFAVMLVHLPTPALLGLVLVAATATAPFEAARSALTVESVPKEDYGHAVALLDMTDQSAVVAGYLVGGVSVLLGGVSTALLVNVASFLLSAVVLSRVREGTTERSAEAVTSQLGRGLRVMWSETVMRRGIMTILVAGLPVAAVEATAAAYARIVLHAAAGVTGELAAAVPVGILLAVPLLPKSGSARHLLRAAAAAAMLGSLVAGVAFGVGGLPGALVGYLAAGVLSGSATPAQIAFQPRIAARDRPAIFSLAQMLLMGGQALGAVVGGLVASSFGPRHADLGWMGLVFVLSLVAFLVPERRPAPERAAAAVETEGHALRTVVPAAAGAMPPVPVGGGAMPPVPVADGAMPPVPVAGGVAPAVPVRDGARPWRAAVSPWPSPRARPTVLVDEARPWRGAATPLPRSPRRPTGDDEHTVIALEERAPLTQRPVDRDTAARVERQPVARPAGDRVSAGR